MSTAAKLDGSKMRAQRGAIGDRLLRYLSLRHPWAWRIRLDLILAFNLAFALLAASVRPITERIDLSYRINDVTGAIAFLGSILALGCAFYWIYAVTKGKRLREAAKHGSAPSPITAALALSSLGIWVLVATAIPEFNTPRDNITGEIERISTDVWLRVGEPPIDTVEYPSLYDLLWSKREKSRWEASDIEKALRFFRINSDARSALARGAAEPGDDFKGEFLSDLAQLRHQALQSKWLVRGVVKHIGKTAPLRMLQSQIGTKTAEEYEVRLEAVIAQGFSSRPQGLTEEAWGELENAFFRGVYLPSKPALNEKILSWSTSDQLQAFQSAKEMWAIERKIPQAVAKLQSTGPYKVWRKGGIIRSLVVGGVFDDVIKRSPLYADAVSRLRRDIERPSATALEKQRQDLEYLARLFLGIVIVALTLAVFTSLINLSSASEVIGSVLLFLLSTVFALVLVAIAQGFYGWNDDKVILIAYASLTLAGVSLALVPAVRDIIVGRQTRLSNKLAMVSIWIAITFGCAGLLVVFTGEQTSIHEIQYLIVAGMGWMLVGVCVASLVHFMLTRHRELPRIK